MTPDWDYSDYVRDMLEMAQALQGFVADMEYEQFAVDLKSKYLVSSHPFTRC